MSYYYNIHYSYSLSTFLSYHNIINSFIGSPWNQGKCWKQPETWYFESKVAYD